MRAKFKLSYLSFIMFFAVFVSEAQDVAFKTICKRQVVVGEQFQVSYELTGDGKDFKSPNFENFEIIGGPFSSTSSSVQIINGSVSKTSTQTYSFYLRAIKEGTFQMPPATITVNKKKITSEPTDITVVANNSVSSSNPTNGNNASGSVQGGTSKDVFLEATPNKKKLFLGEQTVLTYKIYFTIPVSQLSISKAPSYAGFWTKDITSNNGTLQQSSVVRNNQEYNVATIQEVVLFPQKTGKLTIDPLDINCIAQIRTQKSRPRGYDPFESFFDDIMGSSYTNVKKDIKSQPITIEVQPLPVEGKPVNFKGAVGQFSFNSKIDKTSLKANEAFTLTLTVSGKGNIELLEMPSPVFPPDFEVYDPKITTDIKQNSFGISGTKKAEYIVIPRASGDFRIDKIDFSYFDPVKEKYTVISSNSYDIQVEKNQNEKGDVIYASGQEGIKYIGSDIQHINTSNVSLKTANSFFFFSTTYIVIIVIALALFFASLFISKKINKFNQNETLVRNKKATKTAKKKLQKAYGFLQAKNQNGFYEEYSQAIWGYIADKLNIARSQLSMETVHDMMLGKGVTEEITNEFIELLNRCEFARFAPGDASAKMESLYKQGIDVITKTEKLLK